MHCLSPFTDDSPYEYVLRISNIFLVKLILSEVQISTAQNISELHERVALVLAPGCYFM